MRGSFAARIVHLIPVLSENYIRTYLSSVFTKYGSFRDIGLCRPRRHMIAGGEAMGDPYAQCKESARDRLQPCRT
jgi:hypothetical protein